MSDLLIKLVVDGNLSLVEQRTICLTESRNGRSLIAPLPDSNKNIQKNGFPYLRNVIYLR